LFSDHLRQEAEKYHYPVIEVQKNGEDVQRILAALDV